MSGWSPPSREELELDQIKADLALERAQTQWEPWKALTAAFGAGAAFATAIAAAMAFLFAHILR
jgi:hypothetical protein